MKNLFTICLLFLTTLAFSQDLSFGVRGGLNFANGSLSGDADQTGNGVSKKSRTSINLGAYALKKLNDKAGVQVELYYSGEGYQLSGGGQTETDKINFINLAALYKYVFAEKFYFLVGPQLGFRAAANATGGGQTIDISKYVKSINLSLVPGVGYDINETIGVSLRYQLGLSNLYDASGAGGGSGTYKSNVIQIVVGYKFGGK